MPSSKKKSSPHENTIDNPRSLVADMEDSFQARPTNRLGKDHKIKADGDTWQEMMAVCEAPEGSTEIEGQLIIRSYYQNSRTNERVWDEPPSGATNIIPASDEVRRMANMQLEELHLVKKGKKKTEKKKTTLMGKLFGGNKKKEKKKGKRRIEYKPGSQMYANRATQDTEDAMMQEAIAASIAESKGETYVRPPPEQRTTTEDEMAMAQALSMSAAEHDAEANALAHALSLSAAEHENVHGQTQAAPQIMHQAQTEDEILAQVMEQSKLETKRGEGDLLNMPPGNMIAPNNPFDAPLSPQDRKMRVSEVQAMNNNHHHHQYPMYPQLHQDHHFPAMTPASSQPYASASASAAAANSSAQYAASSNAAAAASASQYAAAMAASAASPPPPAAAAAAAVSPPSMKAPPSYSMAPTAANSNTSPQPPPTNYPSNVNATGGGVRYLDPQQELLQIESELEQIRSTSLSPATYQQQQQQSQQPTVMRIPVNAPSMPSNAANNNNNPSAAMFDPYSKDAATQSAAAFTPSASGTERTTSNSGLQKMEGSSSTSSSTKMSLFKRKSHTANSTKVQDKAGLV